MARQRPKARKGGLPASRRLPFSSSSTASEGYKYEDASARRARRWCETPAHRPPMRLPLPRPRRRQHLLPAGGHRDKEPPKDISPAASKSGQWTGPEPARSPCLRSPWSSSRRRSMSSTLGQARSGRDARAVRRIDVADRPSTGLHGLIWRNRAWAFPARCGWTAATRKSIATSTRWRIRPWGCSNGRAVPRVTPTYTSANFFIRAKSKLVGNQCQEAGGSSSSCQSFGTFDTDDLWLRVGQWKIWI